MRAKQVGVKNALSEWHKWVKRRPTSVKVLALEFPFGSTFLLGGRRLYLLGYASRDHLIVSETNPFMDYEKAHSERAWLPAYHARIVRESKDPG
jgi:hypothetical protein